MGLVLATTAALSIGIVLWAINLSGLDSLIIGIAIVLVALGVHSVLPGLPGRRS
jgi:hypothetical protein